MKKILFVFTLLSILSCNSPRKLLSAGNDLQVINQVLKKEVKRKAKQEDIHYFEKAFANYQNERYQAILSAQKGNGEKKWATIAKEAGTLIELQKHIQRQLPIQAKNGYKAKVKFEDVSAIYENSVQKASLFHKEKGESLLAAALLKENVHYARSAYEHLMDAQKYDSTLDLEEKIEQARQLGTIRILTSVDFPFWRGFSSSGLTRREAETQLIHLLKRPRGSKWIHFIHPNSKGSPGQNIDYELRLSMVDFDVSNGRTSRDTKSYSKQIEEVAKDKDGKPILDKDGNPIKTYRNVEATLAYETSYQEGEVKLELTMTRMSDHKILYSQYLNEQKELKQTRCIMRGDERALPSKISCDKSLNEISKENVYRQLINAVEYDFDAAVKRAMKDF